MAKVIFRQKALNDLNQIWNYTYEKWSEKQADKYYNTIKMACAGISKNLLGLKAGKHIIFYQTKSSNTFEVIRILHEAMDLKNRISE